MLVEDVVMMGRYGHMNFRRIPAAKDRAAVDTALARVGMADYRKREIGELSGGQRKRVFLARARARARALAQDGRVILLDEPFTGVDVKTEEAIIGLLRDLRAEGRVMLVSTHNLGGVLRHFAFEAPEGGGRGPVGVLSNDERPFVLYGADAPDEAPAAGKTAP